MKRKRELTDWGKMVKKRLIDKNMSMTELADSVGTSNVYLCDMLCGVKSERKYKSAIENLLEMESA